MFEPGRAMVAQPVAKERGDGTMTGPTRHPTPLPTAGLPIVDAQSWREGGAEGFESVHVVGL